MAVVSLLVMVAMLGCALPGTTPSHPQPVSRAPDADFIIYDNALQNGFEDWSWAPHNLANTAPTYTGSRSIAITYTSNYDGLWLVNPSGGTNTAGYSALRFAIHGGTSGGQTLEIRAGSSTSYPTSNSVNLSTYLPSGALAGTWRVVTIPLADLNLQNTTLANVAFQSLISSSQPTLYLDDIRLVSNMPASGAPTATVRIQANGAVTPIDTRLLGTNLAAWNNPDRLANPTFRARTAASGVSVIRMPGGSWSNQYGWLSCELGANQTGTLPCGNDGSHWENWAARPTDFIDFLKAVGKPGMWVASINGTSKEAAAAVAFFNSAITDTTSIGVDIRGTDWYTAGHWAQLRAADGNPQPLGIKLWGVGNEVYAGKPGSGTNCNTAWGWEDVWTCDGTEYINGVGSGASRHEGFIEFRNAMRAVDPTIQVGAVGITNQSSWNNWGNKVIAAAGQDMDYYDVHQYAYDTPPADYATALAQPQSAWPNLKANIIAAYNTYAGGRAIPIGVTEHNLVSAWNGDNNQWMTRTVNALFIADSLGQMMVNGFAMGNQWLLGGNTAANGTDYGLLHLDAGVARSPQYFAYVLWSRFGDQLLPVTSTVDAVTTLSVYAGRVNSDTLSLLAINKTGNPITTTIEINGSTPILEGAADVARANSLSDATMSLDEVAESALADDLSNAPSLPVNVSATKVTYAFAPYSITLLRLRSAQADVSPRAFVPYMIR